MEYALEIKNISKIIKDKKIINNLSFNVRCGEVLGLLGPNGAGKTTTIRMIVGLASIDSGDILIDGESIKTNRVKALKNIGAIVENPELYPYMTGGQNLKYFASMYKNIGNKEILEVAKVVKLEDALNQKVSTYSLGMKQRLGIAVSLLHNPKILILDEPTNGLDPSGIKEMRSYLKELAHNKNIAIVVSSHILSEVELMSDKVVIMQKGRVIREVSLLSEKSLVSYTYIEVNDSEKAKDIILLNIAKVSLNTIFDIDKVKMENKLLKVTATKDEVQAIIKILLSSGIEIYNVAHKTESLEDLFLHSTEDISYGY